MNGQAINRGVQDNQSVTIPSGSKVSPAIPTAGGAFGSFQLPGTITGSALTIEFSNDKANWTSVPVASSQEANPITVGVNGTYPLPVNTFAAKYYRFNFASDSQSQDDVISLYHKG